MLILNYVKDQRGFDFSGYRPAMLERRIQKRIYGSQCKGLTDYLNYLTANPDELDNLIDTFTINVSQFFRNSLCFEFLSREIVPEMIMLKNKKNDQNIRIWSAGCSFGEEPYSMAIILNELLEREKTPPSIHIFATDIDRKALMGASQACYEMKSMENVKYAIFKKYFQEKGSQFLLSEKIKDMVGFSFNDLLDTKSSVPIDSIYGSFDIILCRNVLIYLDMEFQKVVFNKLYKALKPDGYLILGEAEALPNGFKHHFRQTSNYCKLYRKLGE